MLKIFKNWTKLDCFSANNSQPLQGHKVEFYRAIFDQNTAQQFLFSPRPLGALQGLCRCTL